MTLRAGLILAAVVVAAVAAWLWREWQPENQVRRAMLGFLDAVERRDWESVRNRIAADYADRWGFDRSSAITSASEALRHFFVIEITANTLRIDVAGPTARSAARLHIDGNGTPVAHAIISHVNALGAEFILDWRRENWKPWSWRLYSVEQPELALPAATADFP